MNKIYLFLTFMLLAVFTYGQKATIKGKIINVEDNSSLPGATVQIEGAAKGSVTDAHGNYTIVNVDAGTYTLVVNYIGFISQKQTITISATTFEANFTLKPGIDLDEVVINERLVGQAKAYNTQKNAMNIENVVSEEQLSRFPDANIGDALKRLPGINVQYDQGEARFGNFRGIAPALNSVTVNGDRIPSAEAEIRSIQLDLIPSDMVKSLEFNKALTPDMDADAIGGLVNIVTKGAPTARELKAQLGTGYNFVSEKFAVKGSLSYGERFFKDKLGLMLSISEYHNPIGSDDIEAEWDYSDANDKDGSAFMTNFQTRQYYLTRFRQSYSANLDYKINQNHTLYLRGIFTKREDWENRFRNEFKNIEWSAADNAYKSEVRRQTKFGAGDNKYSRLEDQRVFNFAFGGDHNFGKLIADWSASMDKASEERPEERYITYRAKNVLFNVDLTDQSHPQIILKNPEKYGDFTDSYSFKELTNEYQYTEEMNKNFKLNFQLPIMEGAYASNLKFGGKYRGKEKSRDNWLYSYDPTDEDAFDALIFDHLRDVSKDNYMPGNYTLGSFVDPKISDFIDLNNTADFDSEEDISANAGDFEASEQIIAGYAMYSQNIKEKLTILAGLRVEKTMINYQGRIFETPASGDATVTLSGYQKSDYTNLLPGIHAKYKLNQNSNIRAAWTNTISRPNYYDITPHQEIELSDNIINIGNPDLLPTTSSNYDFLYDYYFKSIGIISAGAFYKDIKNVMAYEFKTNYDYNGHVYDEFYKPANIGSAHLYGLEFSLSNKLTFLPGIMKNLTFYANYTYIHSQLYDITFKGRENEDLPMGGSPTNTLNLALGYDSKKLDVVLSYNHTSAFLNVNDDGGFGEEAFFDFYYDKTNYLDLNIEYNFNKHWGVYANANNLLNQPLRVYIGSVERTYQEEYYGIKFNVGLKFKL